MRCAETTDPSPTIRRVIMYPLMEEPAAPTAGLSDVLVMPPQNGFTLVTALLQGKHLRRHRRPDFCEHRSQEFRRRCHAVT